MQNPHANPEAARPKPMSEADFASWGMPDMAFVKRIAFENAEGENAEGWSIHAADGTQMGLAPSREIAFAAIRQHELEPLSVH
ncbi:MAG: DUF1150 domain-containing protein [Magnetospirillum sp.]|nr:DUF1150 domain-containing protein [Magnetospirillum sp.]